MAKISYGEHTYGRIKVIGASRRGRVLVGRYCSIAEEVSAFMFGDHRMDYISTYPFGHTKSPISVQVAAREPLEHYIVDREHDINIGNDVWLGYGATIFRGVSIGDGAAIGAFAKVTKDIPHYSVVVGDSRIIGVRFSVRDVNFLLRLRWWDLPDEQVAAIAPLLGQPDVGRLREWASVHGRV